MLKMIAVAACAAGLTLASPVRAADNTMKVCGAKYQAAKMAKTLPAGQSWQQFLAQCRGSTAPKSATVAAAAPKPSTARPSHLPGAQSPAMQAMHARETECGKQWKAAKAAGKTTTGQKWPEFWSACNKRLKG